MTRRIRNLTLFTLVTLTLAVSITLLYLCYLQATSLIYTRAAPLTAYAQTPADFGIGDYGEVEFLTPDGLRLYGWYIPPLPAGDGATVLFLHGHAGSRMQFMQESRELRAEGYGMLLFDQRNNAMSEGTVTSMGYYETEDALTAYAWLTEQPEVNADKIVIYGGSMGGTTAIRAMARLPQARALVVDTAYTSLRDAVGDGVTLRTGLPPSPFAEIIVWMCGGMAGANLFEVRPIDDIAAIAPRPVLLMHGDNDGTILVDHARRLYAAAGEPKQLYIVPGGVHGDTYVRDPQTWREIVLPFLRSALS
jgi:dipeptidyl aminopeptidase/acylaminoacyl peptidase